ncbi:MAG: (2Fe-2S)-binding protein [Candidatus Marsarchaeota archaeon]|nr:(2Fe-2S)-binding protein [Candidatus Marsarchaeota archaeon]
MEAMNVKITINGKEHSAKVETRQLLVHFIRESAGLTGTHVGCDTSNCGACTVLLDGKPVKSCTVLSAQANGKEVTTIEGLGSIKGMDKLQKAFIKHDGLQCGFCTPGMIMEAHYLLKKNPNASEEEIRSGIDGNLCRCTGYVGIIEAIKSVQNGADNGKA